MTSRNGKLRRWAARPVAAIVVLAALGAVVLLPRFYGTTANSAPEASVTRPIGAMQDPSISPGPASSAVISTPAPNSSVCQTIVSTLEWAEPSVKTWSAASDAVVNASIVSVGPGRWATADGSKPSGNLSATNVYRVVTIQIGEVGRTTPAALGRVVLGSQITVRILGGKIGCSSYLISGQPDLTVGQSAIWFLTARSQPPLVAAPAQQLDVIDDWPIVDGSVATPDGTMTARNVLQAASLAP